MVNIETNLTVDPAFTVVRQFKSSSVEYYESLEEVEEDMSNKKVRKEKKKKEKRDAAIVASIRAISVKSFSVKSTPKEKCIPFHLTFVHLH